ncbi:hypothetical protein D7X74_10115 [Corallococcus sp. CA047B]|nr:hypothetical protein D7X74_10115 [Corallococcus sp. CA047B]
MLNGRQTRRVEGVSHCPITTLSPQQRKSCISSKTDYPPWLTKDLPLKGRGGSMVNWFKRLSMHRHAPRWRILVATGALAVASLLTPGSAVAQDDSPCPFSGVLCLFDGVDYTGAVWNVRSITPGVGVCVNLPEHGWEDRAYSAINTGNYYASLFLNEDCVGGPHPVDPHSGQSTLPFQPKSVWVY